MIGFWVGAAVLSLGALSFVLLPAWRSRQSSGRWSRLGVSVASLLVPVSVGLYLGVNTWNGETVVSADSLPPVAELVAGLEARLSENPDDAFGWQLLGQSYMAMGLYPDARQALREAWGRTTDPDNELKLALGEAEALTDRQALLGAAGDLFEEVLATEPANPKALWYGGLAALETQRGEGVRERWTQLLALGPPAPVAEVLRQQLASMAGSVSGSAPSDVRIEVAEAPEPTGLQLQLRVTLAEGLSREGFGPTAALFIFARDPNGGPPLAVIRQGASAVPGEFSLSDANAMLPGRSLADSEALTIVARISASGQPTASPGDLFGELTYRTAEGSGGVDLVIDQVAQ